MSEKSQPATQNASASTRPIGLSQEIVAPRGMIYVSYCGFNHGLDGLDGLDEESPEKGKVVDHKEPEAPEIIDVPLNPTNTVDVSSDKELSGNHGCNPSPTIKPMKTPASNNRSEQTKAVPETIDVPLYQTNTIYVSSEKKLIEDHGRNPSPTITSVKTPALHDQGEETKAVGNPSKSLLTSVRVWLSQRICNTVRICRRAVRWVGRRIFRR